MTIITINIGGSGMSFAKETMQKNVEKLISYIDTNCSKKVTTATINDNELTIKLYGGLDDSQIERIQNNFNWIDGLELDSDSKIIFSLNM